MTQSSTKRITDRAKAALIAAPLPRLRPRVPVTRSIEKPSVAVKWDGVQGWCLFNSALLQVLKCVGK